MQHQSSASCAPYALFRVKQDGIEEQVSEHPSFEEEWNAGTHAVSVDGQSAFSLYLNGRRVARFGHSRLQPRRSSFEWLALS
jgi:hypothetical protein